MPVLSRDLDRRRGRLGVLADVRKALADNVLGGYLELLLKPVLEVDDQANGKRSA